MHTNNIFYISFKMIKTYIMCSQTQAKKHPTYTFKHKR